jgi:hypothetical protein
MIVVCDMGPLLGAFTALVEWTAFAIPRGVGEVV